MSDEQDRLKVSLEPPKLFGRKKKSDKATGDDKRADSGDEASRPEEPAEPEPGQEPEPETVQSEPAATEPEAVEPESTPPEEPENSDEEQPGETVDEPVDEAPTEAHEELESPEIPEDVSDAPQETEIEPEPAVEAAVAEAPEPQRESSFVDKLRSRFGNDADAAEVSDTEAEDAEIASGAYTAPLLSNYAAATLTGGIVGLGLVVLTWLSLRGCEAISDACSSGTNFLLLIAIFIVSVMVGSRILKSFSVPDPGSTSFLAVGLVAVISLLLLVDVLDHWSMLIVIPVVSIGGFLLSAYITKTFVEPDES